MEGGCRQYGSVRYDSYFSYWNRLDRLNSWTDADDIFVEENEGNNCSLPHSYDIENSVKKTIIPNNYNNSYDHASYKKNGKIDDSNSKNNFYKFSSRAHKEEKILESYIDDLSSSSTLKLQIKIIIEKSEKLQSQSQSSKKMKIETLGERNENDNDNDNDKSVTDIEKNKVEVSNTTAFESLIQSMNNCDDVSISARNIKVQENNDDRSHALSFISLPTLTSKNLTLEAVSVILIEKEEVRYEAWKQLEILKLKSKIRKK